MQDKKKKKLYNQKYYKEKRQEICDQKKEYYKRTNKPKIVKKIESTKIPNKMNAKFKRLNKYFMLNEKEALIIKYLYGFELSKKETANILNSSVGHITSEVMRLSKYFAQYQEHREQIKKSSSGLL